MHNGEFQPIEEGDEQRVGPPAILVAGFTPEIEAKLTSLLEAIEASSHRVIFCTEEMIKQSLEQALESEAPGTPAAADKLPRVIVLSGLTGAQLQAFLQGYRSTGLPRPIFASATPINLEFPVGKLVMELRREQRAMSKRR